MKEGSHVGFQKTRAPLVVDARKQTTRDDGKVGFIAVAADVSRKAGQALSELLQEVDLDVFLASARCH
ncbi:hypothetical protein D3C71_2156710 [compost metagenome]